jgi:hypothetical protein
MNILLTSGVLAVSIDLELDVERRSGDQQQSLETAGRQLVDLLGKYRMPATWAVADPALSAATERILTSSTAHEIAILGDRTWVGREADRPRFARELTRRATRGRTAGLAISTLLLRGTELVDHLDLVVKQGITVVARSEAPQSGRLRQPRQEVVSLRFGLWQLPTQLSLPARRDWRIWQSPAGRAKAMLADAVAQRAVVHLSISGLAAANRSVLVQLERVLIEAAAWRETGQLAIETFAATARRLAGPRQAKSARSILQPAA